MFDSKDDKLNNIAEKNGYTLDYLSSGSPIFQVKNLYTFTSDSISLAHSVDEEKIEHLVDLCSGSGVVGLEVAGNKDVSNLTMVELQKDLANASKLSADNFIKRTKVNVINDSVLNLENYIGEHTVDVVVCNPPYFKKGSGEISSNQSRAMARHEIFLTLEDIIKEAKRLLKVGGKFYLIHINSRIAEIEKLLDKYNFILVDKYELKGKLERVIIKSKIE